MKNKLVPPPAIKAQRSKIIREIRLVEPLNVAVQRAIADGWTLHSQDAYRADLTKQRGSGMDTGIHIAFLALTLLTCGLGFLLWIPCWILAELSTPGRRALHIERSEHTGVTVQTVKEI